MRCFTWDRGIFASALWAHLAFGPESLPRFINIQLFYKRHGLLGSVHVRGAALLAYTEGVFGNYKRELNWAMELVGSWEQVLVSR